LALEEGRRAIALMPVEKDAVDGSRVRTAEQRTVFEGLALDLCCDAAGAQRT